MMINPNRPKIIALAVLAVWFAVTGVSSLWLHQNTKTTAVPTVETPQKALPTPAFAVVQPYPVEIPPPTPNDPFFERWN